MEIQLVVFTLCGEDYGFPIEQVREINRFEEITPVPKAPEAVLGVINLRGSVIPVIDLRKELDLEKGSITQDSRIVISEVNGETIGVLVDSVSEVIRINSDLIETDISQLPGMQLDFIRGVGKTDNRLIIILDLEKVLSLETIAFASNGLSRGDCC